MRRIDKKHNMSKVNLLAEQRHLQSKGLIIETSTIDKFDESKLDTDLIEEGWKEWLAAGLIAASTIGGVYKFNQDKIQNDKAGTELIQKSKSILDTMSNQEKKELIQSLVDKGKITQLQSGLHLVGSDFGDNKISHDSSDSSFMDDLVEKAMQSQPGWFGVTKDGKIVAI